MGLYTEETARDDMATKLAFQAQETIWTGMAHLTQHISMVSSRSVVTDTLKDRQGKPKRSANQPGTHAGDQPDKHTW